MPRHRSIVAATLFGILLLVVPLLLFFIGNQERPEGRIVVNKSVDAPFLDKSTKRVTLLFFGYVGCGDVCTPLLYELHQLYRSEAWDAMRKEVDVVFVNLTPQTDPQSVQQFSFAFDKAFRGVYLDRAALSRISREFRLFFSVSLFDVNSVNHTDHLYVIENGDKRILRTIYTTHPLSGAALTQEVAQVLGESR